jgi:hypothetical protein
MSDVSPNRDKRYHVCRDGTSRHDAVFRLVEGIPDPARPQSPSKDRKDGPTLVTGPNGEFWRAVNLAGFIWTGTFERYWSYNPEAAAKIREGRAML